VGNICFITSVKVTKYVKMENKTGCDLKKCRRQSHQTL